MLGVAVIGCGLIGTKRALAMPPGAGLVAVHDVRPERARELAARCGGRARVCESAAEAMAVDGVGLVVIATVHRDLAPLAAAAVDQARHVLIEKPGACRPDELEAVRRSAEQRGVIVRVGFNHRFHPALMQARDVVGEPDRGPLLYVRARYGHGGRPGYDREWRADPAISGGGELMDQGIHLIDLTRYLVGDVDLAFAELTSAFWSMPVEDNAFVCLRVRGGGTAWLHASWTEWKNLFSFEVAHSAGKVEISGLGGSYGVERLTRYDMRSQMGPPDTRSWEWPRGDDSWAAELDDVVGAIDGRPGRGATINDAIAALTVIQAAYRSSPTRPGAPAAT